MPEIGRSAQLDELMLMRGLITVTQLEEARAIAAGQRRSVARVLVDMGLVTENAAMLVLAERMGLEVMDLTEAQFDASAVAMVPEAVARRYACIAMSLDDHKLVIAMADPANVVAIDDIRAITKLDVRTVVAARSDVMAAITRHYR
ncbi:MAG: type II secretion system protein GspE, partial [Actinobacteria bacterium]|nr:type II secretion system protein GspE [Actinomycetota bacterium]